LREYDLLARASAISKLYVKKSLSNLPHSSTTISEIDKHTAMTHCAILYAYEIDTTLMKRAVYPKLIAYLLIKRCYMDEKQIGNVSKGGNLWITPFLLSLIVVLLAGILWLLLQQNALERQSMVQQQTVARQVAQAQQQQTLVTNYINNISTLMVQNKLLTAPITDPARVSAQAQTLVILQELNRDDKGILMRFLYQTKLINNDYHIISMVGADLRGANLASLDLRDTDLTGADLTDADLQGTNLSYATLSYANFTDANLRAADLAGAELHNMTVTGADMTGADMKDAFNPGSTSFAQAKSLSHAIMPDGTKHP
jgi:uncharacterized protein YjbI with pentapeptide repeats